MSLPFPTLLIAAAASTAVAIWSPSRAGEAPWKASATFHLYHAHATSRQARDSRPPYGSPSPMVRGQYRTVASAHGRPCSGSDICDPARPGREPMSTP